MINVNIKQLNNYNGFLDNSKEAAAEREGNAYTYVRLRQCREDNNFETI